ncbi:YrrS family protein [Bacillus sp. FJAT-45350]|uniref:YrrS family protein n=1 Tax=Bacillus sp. FJAT-45350 TaxID=2011014 RepID=UPI000BB92548|nr:YrrS family protein [Bacillus sp. FJAT-45350]
MDYNSTRFEQRKKKRVNKILNISIGIVAVLILFFGSQLIFGTSSNEDAMTEVEEEETIEEEEVIEEENIEEAVVEEEIPEIENNNEEEQIEEDEEELLEPVDGEWQPIGTQQQQQEPFEADFTRDGQNWNEMKRALEYATGLGDNIIIWRLENGGNLQSAVGTVSDYQNQSTPYQVRLEWTNRGWQPVNVNTLDKNPYN